jgi:hypothetical protein
MCNIKQARVPPQDEGRTWTYVGGQRMRVVFSDEARPAEPHIVVQRLHLEPPPPSRAMMTWINGLRAKYQLGGI